VSKILLANPIETVLYLPSRKARTQISYGLYTSSIDTDWVTHRLWPNPTQPMDGPAPWPTLCLSDKSHR